MNIFVIFSRSIAFGALAALLWIVFWSVAFPDVWAGHGEHTVLVFVLSSVAYGGAKLLPILASLLSGLR